MAATITVPLTDEQVVEGLRIARLANPTATNADLLAELQQAAWSGPGIRAVLARWAREAFRQQRDYDWQAQTDAFLTLFPDDLP